jgi:UDP-glucose 4-epimerase
LEHANKKKKPVLIASTSEVYGMSNQIPFREDDPLVIGATTKARWSYACSKALDEFLALAYWREKRLPVIIARLFNTIGPRQTGQYGMVVPNFVKQALSGRPITVYGDGTQTRCFVDVLDVSQALMRLMDCADAIGQVFNIGSTEEITILALAQRVREMTKSSSEIQMIAYDHAYGQGFEDMHRRIPDTAKIRKTVGFQPRWTLGETLERIIAHWDGREHTGIHHFDCKARKLIDSNQSPREPAKASSLSA